ncbi:MAG: cytochrome c3 family protein [Desulfuromonadales bacterium]|nr:cytochrome c3 family protein [Desulfuromonadales bacterium]
MNNDYAARDRSSGDMLVAYTPVFAVDTTITGQAGSNVNFKDQDDGSYTGRVRLVEINNAGDAILNNFGEVTVSGSRNSWRYITDLSTLSGTINSGNRLGLVVGASAGSANVRSFFSQDSGGNNNEIWFVVNEVSANTTPSLIINLPDGTETPITVGDNYSIDYDLEDTEDEVTVAFFYDTDTDPAVKTAITGPCAAAGEGVGTTCAWNTTGVSAGTYYIYGVTSDGTNPLVTAYSSGQVTINPVVNSTTAGTATALRGNSAIDVSASYTDDDNGDNTLLVEWGLNGEDFSLGSEALAHSVSPYTYQISGLTNGVSYQVRVTYQDSPDGVTGTAVQIFTDIVPVDFNPLIHSAISTGSSKWGGDWGIDGGKYGEFTCNTCHQKGSSNIKRIKEKISFPDGSPMPNGQLNSVVVFSNTKSGAADFGDDGDGRNTTASNRICEVCHSITDYHRSGTFNTPTLTHNNKSDCIDCHQHKLGFKPVGNCAACHDVNSTHPTAPKVVDVSGGTLNGQAYGSHLKATNGDDLSSVDWAEQCGQCHEMHSGSVFIKSNPAVGINYTDHGGIYLGGPSTNPMINTKTTEAEICWGCHDSNGGSTSEWNAMVNDGFTVTGGSRWNTATFELVGNSIPDRSVLSIHTANEIDTDSGGDVRSSSVANNVNWSTSVGTLRDGVDGQPSPVLEDVGAIRCSYCHDVHGTADYSGVIAAADDPDDAPYLRGSWMANPYPIERPPETGDSYAGNVFPGHTGRPFPDGFNVPRLYSDSVGSASIGGFFIDQNSGYPTRKADNTYMTVEEVGGLCTLCHGNDVDNMNYYTTENLWQGVNGHSNSTVSGNGDNAVDLFDARRGSTTYTMHFQSLPAGAASDRRWGKDRNGSMPFGGWFNGGKPDKDRTNNLPPRNTGWYGGTPGATDRNPSAEYGRWYNNAGDATAIGTNGDGNTTRAHSFSCSKCHAPHASGLPALLVTNCLDPAIATWSNDQGSTTVGPGAWGGTNTRNRYNAMGNCHRNEGTTSGWNKLAAGE